MKNLFLSVALLLTISFTFATNDVEKQSTNDVEETINLSEALDNTEFSISYLNLKDEGDGGYCTITITDNQTGEIVHQSTIYVNSAAACKAALKAVLQSL